MTLSHIPLGHYGLTQIQRNDTDLKIPIQPLGHYGLTQIQRLVIISIFLTDSFRTLWFNTDTEERILGVVI